MAEEFGGGFAAADLACSDPWRVLLRQPCVTNSPAVYCRLLCCSKQIRNSLIELNGGQLQLRFTPSGSCRAEGLGDWLAKHAALLAELHLLPWPGYMAGEPLVFASKAIDTALQRAAVVAKRLALPGSEAHGAVADGAAPAVSEAAELAAPGLLPLRSLRYVGYSSTDGAVLQHLSSKSLTELELRVVELPAAEELLRNLGRLCRLTSLQSLALNISTIGTVADTKQQLYLGNRTMKVIAGLSQLRRLSLEVAAVSTSDLQQVPDGVQDLQVICTCNLLRDEQQPALQLRHLSQLTSLVLGPSGWEQQAFTLKVGDDLPLQLQHLKVSSVQLAEPLLPLQQLRDLHVYRCTTDLEMQRLTALTGLTALRLGYDVDVGGEQPLQLGGVWTGGSSSCCTWQQLPLVELSLSMNVVRPWVVQALGLAMQLTHLHIGFCTVEATEQQLAAQLSKLQDLQQLWLDDLVLQQPHHHDSDGPGGDLLAHAGQDDASVSSGSDDGIGLQHLQGLGTLSLQPTGAAAEPGCALLAVAARLPVLEYVALYGEMWSAAAMLELQVAKQLTRLVILQHREEEGMDNDVAVSLISSLTALRDAEFNSPALTEACLPALTNLPHLTRLSLNVCTRYRFRYQMFSEYGVSMVESRS
jgi:hypothetical protein